MEFLKEYLKKPITFASEGGKAVNNKFGFIALAVLFVYNLLSQLVTAWKTANITFSWFGEAEELKFGEKLENYTEYLFENDGLTSILKSSLITVLLFALFALFVYLVIRFFKKQNINYMRIVSTLLIANIYIIPVKVVLWFLNIFDAEIIQNLTGILSTIVAIAFVVLNVLTLHKLFEEPDHDNSFIDIMLSISGFILSIAIFMFLFGDKIGSSSMSMIKSLF